MKPGVICGEEVKIYLEQKRVQPQAAAGEAHTRLGTVERRRIVLRTAIENYLENSGVEKTIDAVREAVNHAALAMNNLSFTRGYTPTQWCSTATLGAHRA